ncbi:hypothetical protein BpHYR1_021160 [Brachionus plicatilis]|uniref:Uncharacterized protein n=1 Tax=Brachionus plicatilis TaxID=10195 RepID=A0A3M7R7F1_BRAPC|nr:hypothetical protein BpHYR1_021160 [Brachionus plicatilis]
MIKSKLSEPNQTFEYFVMKSIFQLDPKLEHKINIYHRKLLQFNLHSILMFVHYFESFVALSKHYRRCLLANINNFYRIKLRKLPEVDVPDDPFVHAPFSAA